MEGDPRQLVLVAAEGKIGTSKEVALSFKDERERNEM